MSAVDHDAAAFEPERLRKAVLDELDVAALGVVEAPRPPERVRRRQPVHARVHCGFDSRLSLV